jgi:hypothetical protein
MTTTNILADQSWTDTHCMCVGEDPNPRTSHARIDAQRGCAGAGPNVPDGHIDIDTQRLAAVGDPNQLNSHTAHDAHRCFAVEPLTPQSAKGEAPPRAAPSVGDPTPPAPANLASAPRPPALVLADPLLALAADVLDDLERVRIANENRLRQLTRDETDKDGEERGFGLTLDHPDVARLAALVDDLKQAEHDATLNLQRMVRRHPLGPWIKTSKGVGEKQGARLLASIGDPYWNTLHDRPRTVSELWSYCGYHVLPVNQVAVDTHVECVDGALTSARQRHADTQRVGAGGSQPPTSQSNTDHQGSRAGGIGSNPDHAHRVAQDTAVGVAATRTRGMKANWSPTAKMRLYLISVSIVKAGGPYREIYDGGRTKYADAVHQVECKRCGPAGLPAQPGSALSDGHKHARALRLVSKTILRDLWREAKRLHDLPPAASHRAIPKPVSSLGETTEAGEP